MSNSDVEFAAEDEYFRFETFKNRKSQFMELTFEEKSIENGGLLCRQGIPILQYVKGREKKLQMFKQTIHDG